MEISNPRREENYQEYLLLKNNSDYSFVTFDELSGGVSAVHIEHCFDKQMGPFGCSRGQYELDVMIILRRNGYSVLLESEFPKGKRVKVCDARINGVSAEIKTVESNGRWAIRTKIHTAIMQGAELLVLFFPSETLFSEARVLEGWRFDNTPNGAATFDHILVVVEERVIEIIKPPG